MNQINSRIMAGVLATATLLAIILNYDTFSGSHTSARDTALQKKVAQPYAQTVSDAPRASYPASSAAESPIRFVNELHNCIVRDPDGLKKSLHSSNAMLVSVDDQAVLMDKNADQKIYPASMTKIMTAILAIEKSPDLQEKVTITQPIIDRMNNLGASMAGFVADEEVSELDLLYGAILPSGAECCAGLAEQLSGSEQAFAAQMNRKAKAIGMTNTHFVNTSGLHDPAHYTTSKDLALLLCYALRNSTFRKIFTTPDYTTAPTNKHPNGVSFQSTMFRNLDSPTAGKAKILGGKVGFTDEAGLCLASLASYDGKEYVLVTAGAKDCNRAEIQDALTVYSSFGK